MASKVDKVLKQLLEQIEQGNFARGTALPPERTLAEQFGVSYMTARKAVGMLVDEHYLERRPGVGVYVRQDLPEDKLSRQLGIVLPAWETPEYRDMIIHASRIADQNHWLPKVFYCRFWNDRVIDDALEQCDALMIVAPESLDNMPESRRKDLAENNVPVVVIGLHCEVLDIDCVTGKEALPLAVKKLQGLGHSKIALVVQKFENEEKFDPYANYVACWKKLVKKNVSNEELSRLLLKVEVPHFDLPHGSLKELICRLGKQYDKLPFTSMIVPLSMAWGAVSGVHATKKKVPEDVSIIFIGDRQEAEFYSPKFDMIKVPLADHVVKAWEIIQIRLTSKKDGVINKLVSPISIDGETVRCI